MYFFGQGVHQDINQGMEWWTRAAEMGDEYADNNLGATYFDGTEIKQDYFLAYMWLNAAVGNGFDHSREKRDKAMAHLSEEQIIKARGLSESYVFRNPGDVSNWDASTLEKDAMAEYRFGNKYHDGNGIKQNFEEAAIWYRKAAEQNAIPAEIALGIAYERGEGVKQDYAEAAKWYRRAAEQGDGDAQKFIGLLTEHGMGVEKNTVQAYAWYELAMQMYSSDAVFEQTRLAKEMTQEQVEKAKNLAKEWKESKKVQNRRFTDSPIADPASGATR
jgi:TPR repeat protein